VAIIREYSVENDLGFIGLISRRVRLLLRRRLSRFLRVDGDHFVVAVGIADFDGLCLLRSRTGVLHDILRSPGYFGTVTGIAEIGSFGLLLGCFSS